METNKPRASIHVGADKKSFSAQMGNEAERRGWDEKRYQSKNVETEKNNHYNFSRKHLNFEVIKGCKVVPLGSNPVPLHQRLQQRYDELGFKPYMDAKHPNQVAQNTPNGFVNIIFGGDHEVMKKLAFGEQQIYTSDPYADNSHIKLMPTIYEWAKDTYQFCCCMWGEDNIIGFDVQCDETGVHAHALTVPVEQVKKRGRIGSQYVNKDNPDKVLSTKEWKALPKEERSNYIKTESTKGVVERVSYAKVWGERAKEKSQYLSDLHTKYYNEVGKKYGLERGIPYHELSEEEKRERRHKSKVVLEAERQARQAIAEAEKLKAEIEAETSIATQQKEEALKDLKTAQSGFLAKIFQPGKYKKEEAAKFKESYDAGVKETIGSFIKATGLKWKSEPTTEILGRQYRMLWDTNKDLSNELNTKEEIISSKDVEIRGLRAKVTTLTEEVNGLKYRLTLIDENAVERLRNAKNAETSRADKAESELDSLRSAYQNLLRKWNALWMEPEYTEAARKVKERKEREARLAAEKQNRYQDILNRFIAEGRATLRAFALTTRTNFNDKEATSIYYGIMAVACKMKLNLGTKEGITSAVNNFLSGVSWSDCSKFNVECVTNWTHLFAERDVTYNPSVIDNFISFVDYMSCNAETYTSLGGSNGCADQLTNWDGTKKLGLGSPSKKKGQSY